MNLLLVLGLGTGKILQSGKRTAGTVTAVKTCYWLKVNTKAVRMGPMDGAQFPHMVHFTYEADGVQYKGSRFYNWNRKPPMKGESVSVCYDPSAPQNYAVEI